MNKSIKQFKVFLTAISFFYCPTHFYPESGVKTMCEFYTFD